MIFEFFQPTGNDLIAQSRAVSTDKQYPLCSLGKLPGKGVFHSSAQIRSLLTANRTVLAEPGGHCRLRAPGEINSESYFLSCEYRLQPPEYLFRHGLVQISRSLGAEFADESGLDLACLREPGKEYDGLTRACGFIFGHFLLYQLVLLFVFVF